MAKHFSRHSCAGGQALKRLADFALMATLLLVPSRASGQSWRFPCEPASPLAQAQTASSANSGDALSLKSLPRAIGMDQKPIWMFPLRAAKGHHWKPALAVMLATTGLVFLDSHDAPYFRRTQTFRGFNNTFSGVNTGIAEGTFPVALFLAGYHRHSTYMQQTALLAAEAFVDAQIVSEVMKNASRRFRPSEIPPNGDFGHSWFKEGGGILIGRGSFPSGHGIGAFALATVIAHRYRRHRWVPWAAYGAATLVSFSRVTLQAHFPSDVFAGAALGYSISHFVVLRHQ